MRSPTFPLRAYAVLASLSTSYPPLPGTFRYVTHPFATRRQTEVRAAVRLACVRHAASVQSEPGSNSSVQSLLCHLWQPLARCRSLKILTSMHLAMLTYLFLCEHFMLFEPRQTSCRAAPSSAHTYRLLVVKDPFLTERRVCRRLPYIGCGCYASRGVSYRLHRLLRPFAAALCLLRCATGGEL